MDCVGRYAASAGAHDVWQARCGHDAVSRARKVLYTSCDRSSHAQMQSASVSLDSLHPCVNHYVAGRPPKMRNAGDKEVRACREDIG